jgi:hypothetical protein
MTLTFNDCCREVLLAVQGAKPGQMLTFAAQYARPAVSHAEQPAQALYILVNLGGWRGPRAREVKAALRKIGAAA